MERKEVYFAVTSFLATKARGSRHREDQVLGVCVGNEVKCGGEKKVQINEYACLGAKLVGEGEIGNVGVFSCGEGKRSMRKI
jgi:hypothetical protein